LEECPYLATKEHVEEVIDKPSITEEEFDAKLMELENASYDLNGEKMHQILDDLSAYSYENMDLQKELKSVYKKIDMFDFMSAYEAVAKIRNKA